MASPANPIKAPALDILSGLVDGVVVIDAGGIIRIWNRAAEEMTGIIAADAVGKSVQAVLSENPALLNQIEKTIVSGRSYSDYESELVRRYGPPLPVGLVTSVLTDAAGVMSGVILTIRDETSVRDLKERIRRSDRLAALGMIAAGIAHEIKNPLVGIRGAAQLLKAEIRTRGESCAGGGGFAEYLEVILKEADRLNRVLEGILDFTRAKPRETRHVNVHTILDRALLLNENLARQSFIVLAREYDPSLPDIIGNEDQLMQVFLNIFKNAVEAMSAGGRLSVMTRMSDLFTSVEAAGRKSRLMVVKITDTGSGIKQQDLDHVFTPFFTTKDRGVGLGLALSYQIVQEHHGIMKVESQVGQGTTFSVYLPLAG